MCEAGNGTPRLWICGSPVPLSSHKLIDYTELNASSEPSPIVLPKQSWRKSEKHLLMCEYTVTCKRTKKYLGCTAHISSHADLLDARSSISFHHGDLHITSCYPAVLQVPPTVKAARPCPLRHKNISGQGKPSSRHVIDLY